VACVLSVILGHFRGELGELSRPVRASCWGHAERQSTPPSQQRGRGKRNYRSYFKVVSRQNFAGYDSKLSRCLRWTNRTHLITLSGSNREGRHLFLICISIFAPDLCSLSRDTGQIDRLIQQLGSEYYAERQTATRNLTSLGSATIPALIAAEESPDPEVQRRATRIARIIELRLRYEPVQRTVVSRQSPAEEGQRLRSILGLGLDADRILSLLGTPDISASYTRIDHEGRKLCRCDTYTKFGISISSTNGVLTSVDNLPISGAKLVHEFGRSGPSLQPPQNPIEPYVPVNPVLPHDR
jgi:hypothetical protein